MGSNRDIAIRVERLPVKSLSLDPSNARKHDDKNLSAIRGSLERFGQQKPIVIDAEGVVVAGNGTLAAARAMGWKSIDVVRTPLKGAEARAYAIADNRSGELAEWDQGALAAAAADLKSEGVDLADLGFSDADVAKLTGGPEIVEDEAPEPPVEPITKPGDLWLLGEHRVLCGDSTKGEDVGRLVDGRLANILVTDPPYNLGDKWNGLQALRGNDQVANDDRHDWSAWLADALSVWLVSAMDKDVAGYMWFAWASNPRDIVEAAGLRVHATIVWVKEHFNVGRADYRAQHEECLYFSRGTRQWHGAANEPDVWDARRVEQVRVHPTQKPVSLISRCIANSSEPGATIFDPFLGSGTTLIAAEQLGRKCYGLEIEPKYCDVIVQRWETLAGKKANVQHG